MDYVVQLLRADKPSPHLIHHVVELAPKASMSYISRLIAYSPERHASLQPKVTAKKWSSVFEAPFYLMPFAQHTALNLAL